MSALEAIVRQRCPRCRSGRIFAKRLWQNWLQTNPACPVCGLRFEREQGYFIGAMYVSYALSIAPVVLLYLFFWRKLHVEYDKAMFAAAGAYLPFVPFVSRISRVIWIHIDQSVDPE